MHLQSAVHFLADSCVEYLSFAVNIHLYFVDYRLLLYAVSGFVECHRVATPLSRVIYKSRYLFIHMCIGCSNHISLLSFPQQTGNCALCFSLYMLTTGSISWQGTSNSSMQFVTNRNRGAPTERVVLTINHGRNILQFDIRCKLADEM